MKKIILLFFITNIGLLYGQPCDYYCLTFEDTLCLNHLRIDTFSFPGNIWQIGRPQKSVFNSGQLSPRAIVTDTVHPYPAHNTSVFFIKNPVTMGDIYGMKMFQGAYNILSDSLHDYGRIEFSPDNGTTWIDIINDTVYNASFTWYTPKPILSGNSHGWKHFDVVFYDIGSVFNIQLGDTMQYRFTFKSDNTLDNLDGLMYDNFCFEDFIEGVVETHFKPFKSKIFPNPSTNLFTIEFDNSATELYQLAVYDIHSKLVLARDKISESKIKIDAQSFKSGTYIYKLTNPKTLKRSWGKFIITK